MATERERTKVGHVEAGAVRRIGLRHAVVLQPVVATIVDMTRQRQMLDRIDKRLAALGAERRQLEAKRTEIADTLAQFEAMPIEREDGDPVVPQTAKSVEPDVEAAAKDAELQAHRAKVEAERADVRAALDAKPEG
jgi:hypothetical protein